MTRQAILVLGMHRSGTSALTGLLVHLGVQGPRTLVGANEHNQRGYWESAPLGAFHDRLLHAVGTEWDLWTRVAVNALDPAMAAQFDAEFRVLLEREFGSSSLFVVKDPRICRLVPFWLGHLASASIQPGAVLIVRSPLEVAQSLATRDGLGLEHALLLWLRHVLDAEFATRAIKRSAVRYQDLLLDWTAVARKIYEDIGLEWTTQPEATTLAIEAFLGADLRHHTIGIESLAVAPPLSEWIEQTCAALDCLLEPGAQGLSNATRMLDEVRRAFDDATAAFGPPLEEARRAQRRQGEQLNAERLQGAERLQEIDAIRQEMLALQAVRDDLAQHLSRVEQQVDECRQRASILEAQRDAIERRHGDVQAERESLSQRLLASDERIQALEQSRSWRWTAPVRAVAALWKTPEPPST